MLEDKFKEVKLNASEISGMIDDYIRLLNNKSPMTQSTYKTTLNEFLIFFSKQEIFTFQVKDIVRYKNYLKKKGLSENSLVTYVSSLRRFFKYLMDIGILEKNPARRVPIKIKNRKNDFEFLNDEEIEKLKQSIVQDDIISSRDKAIILLIIYSGLSYKEISSLNIGDFQKVKRTFYVTIKIQNKEPETISLMKEIADIINKYLALRSGLVNPDNPLFISFSHRTHSGRITERGIREIVISRLKTCFNEKGKISPYVLHHTSALHMVKSRKKLSYIMNRFNLKTRKSAERYFNATAGRDMN
jgi:site-specific recombinase XerD